MPEPSADLPVVVSERIGAVSTRSRVPPGARALYVLAHGAGAGMDHPFLEAVCAGLAKRGVGSFRFQFPYTEAGKRRPDPPATLLATVRAAIDAAHSRYPSLPLVAGGKSMGGRMSSQLMAAASHPAVRGLVFLGFPLHPAGRPGSERGAHLAAVTAPMLFLQGTRDPLADLALIRPLVASLGPRATLHVVDGGDHSFKVLVRSGRTEHEVQAELADAVAGWIDRVVDAG
ncbi:alpha/beta family hydrolase [Haliangium sp.]|uniref:alpha/beta hydrolase family protein n=1 Tax=Haliangium sp. TaxID=2663208 RepID=UPI003D0C1919